jgi:hypothetical protein
LELDADAKEHVSMSLESNLEFELHPDLGREVSGWGQLQQQSKLHKITDEVPAAKMDD